eukprot:SM000092S24531  [mRNA]  locus=s92:547777:562774:- [translate_table: standard]
MTAMAAREEEDFPRGGSGALTPLELRQARLEAEDEALSHVAAAAAAGHKRRLPRRVLGAPDGGGEEEPTTGAGVAGLPRELAGKLPAFVELLKLKARAHACAGPHLLGSHCATLLSYEACSPAVCGLAWLQNLTAGTKVLGVVTDVQAWGLSVALPGGLRGHVGALEALDVPASEELKQARTKLRKGADSAAAKAPEANEAARDDEWENAPPALDELFSIGQLVACVVRAQLGPEDVAKKKRAELSLRLSLVNNGFSAETAHEGMVVTACVKSVEDHGCVLTFGPPDVSGFLPHEAQTSNGESAEGTAEPRKVGQLIPCLVSSVDKVRKLVMVSTDTQAAATTTMREYDGLTLDSLVPGALVNARVKAVLNDGLLLTFLTYFTGTLRARILYVQADTKRVGLTLNHDIVEGKPPAQVVQVGEVFEKAVIRRIDPVVGMLLELPKDPKAGAGYVHISNAAEERVDKLEKSFTVGQKVRTRVIGLRLMDALAVLSMKASVIDQLLLSPSDIMPGMLLHGTISAIEPYGLLLKLADGIRALCPLQHLSDVQYHKPPARFQVGMKLKVRVVTCNIDTRKITVTHKRSLVATKLPIITSIEDAKEGVVSHGVLTGVKDYGCFVSFYNNVKGLAHRSELGLEADSLPSKAFEVGQVVKARVLRRNLETQKLSLSFITSSDRLLAGTPLAGKEPALRSKLQNAENAAPGVVVAGLIRSLGDGAFLLDIVTPEGTLTGILQFEHLSDFSGHAEQLKANLRAGDVLEQLLVLERDALKVTLTAKYSLVASAASLPSSLLDVHPQSLLQGFIASITPRGCFVRYLNRLSGLAPVSQLSDVFVGNPADYFNVGHSVRSQILEVDLEKERFTVSLKQSVCASSDTNLLFGYFLEEEKIAELQAKVEATPSMAWADAFSSGDIVAGEVQDVKDYGVIVNLPSHADVVAFVTHYQAGRKVDIGQKVQGVILDISKVDGVVDISMRAELVSAAGRHVKKAGKKRKMVRSARQANIAVNEKLEAVVELVKDDYLVLTLPEHNNAVGFAATRDYNQAVLDPHQALVAKVGCLPQKATGGRLLLLLDADAGVTKKPRTTANRFDVGSTVTGKVLAVQAHYLDVGLGKRVRGRVHVTELVGDPHDGDYPLEKFEPGHEVTARILGTIHGISASASKGHSSYALLELSSRQAELMATGSSLQAPLQEQGALPYSVEEAAVGEEVTAFVQEVHEDFAWLMLSPHLRGRLHVLDSTPDPNPGMLRCFTERFKSGQAVKCRVAAWNKEKGSLDLSLRWNKNGQDVDRSLSAGNVVNGRISRILSGNRGLIVQLGMRRSGRVFITELADSWRDAPLESFEVGQFVACAVVSVGTGGSGLTGIADAVELSLRPSLGGCGGLEARQNLKLDGSPDRSTTYTRVASIDDLKPGQEVQGYVKSCNKKGCFVTLGIDIDAQVLLSNLADNFVDDPVATFPPGKLVHGRVLEVELLSKRVQMTLRLSQPNKEAGSSDAWKSIEDIHVGDVVTGSVKRVEAFGLFIILDHSNLTGLCHISAVSDGYTKDLSKSYTPGDLVKAKVLKVDAEKERISLGLKASYFAEGETSAPSGQRQEEDLGDDMDNSSDNDSDDNIDIIAEAQSEGLETELETIGDEVYTERYELPARSDRDVKSGMEGGVEEEAEQPTSTGKMRQASKALGMKTIDLSDISPLEVDLEDEEAMLEDEEREGGGEEEHLEEVVARKRSKREKRKERELKELAIEDAESRRLAQDAKPETAEDFERLLLTSSSSSFIWVQYMGYFLDLAEVDKARDVAERALKTINYREEAEKLNVWIAYLNLENMYGSPPKASATGALEAGISMKLCLADIMEAVLKLFQRALQYVDKKKLHLALLGIFERGDHHDMVDELFRSMTRKFSTSGKVWLGNIENLLKRGLSEAAHKALDRSLLSLPKRKHIKVISKAALLEFRLGSVERGRAMFEGILRNYPKRIDLWSIYLDQEIKKGDEVVVRGLSERVICLDLPPKKMKFFFKKYLDYENSQGGGERAEQVKAKAMAYVESKFGA